MCHIFLKTRGKIQSISDDSMYHDHHQYDQEAQKHHLSTKVSCLVPTNMNVYHQTTSAVEVAGDVHLDVRLVVQVVHEAIVILQNAWEVKIESYNIAFECIATIQSLGVEEAEDAVLGVHLRLHNAYVVMIILNNIQEAFIDSRYVVFLHVKTE